MKDFLLSFLIFVCGGYALYEHLVLDDIQFKCTTREGEISQLKQDARGWQTEKANLTDQITQLTQKIAQAEATLAAGTSPHPKEGNQIPVTPAATSPDAPSKPVVHPAATPEQLAAREAEVGKSYYVIILKGGEILKRVTVTKVSSSDVSFSIDSGARVVTYDKLPDDMAQRLGLTKEIVVQAAADLQAAKAAGDNTGSSTSMNQNDNTGLQNVFGVPASADQKSKPISAALQARITDLKAQAQKLRNEAALATNQDEAQKKQQEASKIDQLVEDLEDVGGSG